MTVSGMPEPSRGTVMTVRGPVAPEELGVVMMHEHLLHDDVPYPCWYDPPPTAVAEGWAEAAITMDRLGALQRSPFAMLENTRLTRRDPIGTELAYFRKAGGGTVVEVTSQGLVPDPEGLLQISKATGVHVVAGCGFYVEHSLPKEFASWSTESVARRIIDDITKGIAGTSVRAGIIGEIGTSDPITANEEKSLRAAGMAAVETGLAVMVHLGMTGEQAFPAFRILTAEGVPPDRIIMNHMDEANDIDYSRRVADLGCIVEYDTFGSEWYYDTWGTYEPRDTERVAGLARLCDMGYADRLTVSQDVFYKQNLRAYGGWGYSHFLDSVVPMLKKGGVTDSQLHKMVVETPRRLLTTVRTGG